MSTDKFRFPTITAIVIANMVGTGVFTSLGFQLLDITSGFVILLLWALGGLIAVSGAMTYAELGAAFPRSGGEYNFLSEIYHPAVGFVAGWISFVVGFSTSAISVGRPMLWRTRSVSRNTNPLSRANSRISGDV